MKKGKIKSVAGDVGPGAPYGGRWLDGVFYAYADPVVWLTDREARGFERWLVEEAGKKGKWTGRKG